ncbi:Ribosomal protein S18 acetylase RimI [Jannaschia faecimaris]|uniref:Ribosomal protein S18 acetylase RimI n=1 Tax=Jannaschia faecimaris TaxID=1244108 RepID=A0A1H3PX27_9RHOB|nr:GNAT family N-acetyltransferase [Jannaschia faecimaris]SDZ05864.1 Ribosomal protein S18 acetylase RimI [Jannaschia faecimaris]
MIRLATAADREAICALHLASWQDSYGGELPPAYLRDVLPDAMAKKWATRSFAAPEMTFVAEEEGRLVGFVCALTDRDPPLIDNLHVRPDQRGQGTGGALMSAVKDALAADGFDHAYLTVLESNSRALAFYLARGGRDEGTVDDFLVDQPVKARRIGFDLQTRAGMG